MSNFLIPPPRFDSSILEAQYFRTTFPRTTLRFRYGLVYLLLLCFSWSIYFPVVGSPHWPLFLASALATSIFLLLIAAFTHTQVGQHCSIDLDLSRSSQ